MGGRGSPGRVGGQFRPEGWHEVVGRVDRAGWRRGCGVEEVDRLFPLRCFSRCRGEVVTLSFLAIETPVTRLLFFFSFF